MEIDLELSTCHQGEPEFGSFRNGVANSACDIRVEEQCANCPTVIEHCKEISCENASLFCQEQVHAINQNPVKEPQNGLEFESKEAAYCFYREYARSVGFSITIKASRRSKKSGKFIDIKIACSRFGSKRESGATVNPRPCMKTNCKAGMHLKKKPDGKWIIYSIVREHNHEICSDDSLRGRNKQPSDVAFQKKGLQLALDVEDAQLMIEYFFEMRWQKMINRFELKDNGLVLSLFEDRKKWVPTYMQDVFLAGMSTAEREIGHGNRSRL
ncbi:hypothetical protein K1719_017780 [Acacia pycnantha]|nr:hypothetical protein K1719_017780 [Acacia pycnantha]